MSISIIPVQKLPDQEFLINLDGQECLIHIYLRYTNMYMDLIKDNEILFQGKICLNNVDVIQYTHLNFEGELKFVDTQGMDDPYYEGFNERWFLAYVQ